LRYFRPGLTKARRVTELVGKGIDLAHRPSRPAPRRGRAGPEREAVLAALNGVLGLLLETANRSQSRCGFAEEAAAPVGAAGAARGDSERREAARPGPWLVHERPAVEAQGHDRNGAGARIGYVPIYLHYNSGLHISHQRAARWPDCWRRQIRCCERPPEPTSAYRAAIRPASSWRSAARSDTRARCTQEAIQLGLGRGKVPT